jgi:hypothetical protein
MPCSLAQIPVYPPCSDKNPNKLTRKVIFEKWERNQHIVNISIGGIARVYLTTELDIIKFQTEYQIKK